MSLGNLKKLQAAEKLLKQGKTSEALEQLEQLARSAPSDVLTINRMGDLLARQGRTGDAIGYYFKIAKHYADGGYLPKAIAIYKKIVRLDPKSSISLSSLGELYLRQKLPAEAQRFLMTAAQQYEEAGDFDGARDVYKKLVEAAPENTEHRSNLAEALAAAGDAESALAELLNLGDALHRSSKGEQAEKAYLRAQELDPESPEPALGLARARVLQDNTSGAVDCLEGFLDTRIEPQVLSELALLLDKAGQFSDTESLLCRPGGAGIPDTALSDLLDLAISNQNTNGFWERMDRVFAAWQEQGSGDKLGEVLERLTQAEHDGHIPALERFEQHLVTTGNASSAGSVIESLITACRRAGDEGRATAALERLKSVSPSSSLLVTQEQVSTPSIPAMPSGEELPAELEAPAVPLSRSDKEFVTGRLTQAEILEKYSLQDQAIQQVLEVTARFPGHIGAQQKLLALRRPGDPSAVRETLVSLALACRAGGNIQAASAAAAEAVSLGGLDPKTEEALATLGLLTPGAAPMAAQPAPELTIPMEPAPTPVAATPATPVEAPSPSVAASAGATSAFGTDDGLLIDFDSDDEVATPATAALPTDAAPVPVAAVPTEPEQPAAAQAPPSASSEPAVAAGDSLMLDLDASVGLPATPSLGLSDADDLSTITAALEVDAVEAEAPLTPDAGTEQSVDDVFAQFRQAVQEEVGEDSRTHYDLAIGYKEMGLLEEAIDGFKVAAKAPELARESNMMLAVCYREQGDAPNAVHHYRLAASMECEDPEIRVATLYDLAEVLLQNGDDPGALQEFRQVLELDPTYRDAQERCSDLENRLQV